MINKHSNIVKNCASAFQTWDWNEKEWSKGYSVGFGLGSGDYESGWGINCSYGSNGFDVGIGGYYDSHAWDSNPVYEPEKWNVDHDIVKSDQLPMVQRNNCYSYALNDIDNVNHGLQPGHFSGKFILLEKDFNIDYVMKSALADGKKTKRMKKPNFLNKLGFGRKGWYTVYLCVDEYHDYHWYRQDKGGLYSHKPGGLPVTNVDASEHLIKNPAKANHNYGVGRNYSNGGVFLWVRK